MGPDNRFAELIGALSLASDHARGQPPESAIGTTILSTRLAERMGIDGEMLTDVFWTAMGRTLGCTSTAMDVAPLALGDDRSFSLAMHLSDLADPDDVRRNLESRFEPDADPSERAEAVDRIVSLQPEFPAMATPTGQQAAALASRLPLPDGVGALLALVDCRWDGANPLKPAGEDIPVPLRLVEFATIAELFRRAGGVETAVDLASARAGTQFDPEVCRVFRGDPHGFFDGFDVPSLWDLFLETEPAPVTTIDVGDRRAVAEVAADYADNKSGWFVGNSRGVAQLAVATAAMLGLDADDQDDLLVAGLLHDLGRCAVPNGILDKPGPLTTRERRIVDLQGGHTEQILTISRPLRPIARLASSARERLDGSGQPHGRRDLDERTMVLAVADVLVALVSDRPWRNAYPTEDAAAILETEVRAGRLAADPVNAALAAYGHAAGFEPEPPDGLTVRETEVLRLVAAGMATKQIAQKLGIAYKTADNHVQNLYRKIGANTRTAAAMYAIEKGLYSP